MQESIESPVGLLNSSDFAHINQLVDGLWIRYLNGTVIDIDSIALRYPPAWAQEFLECWAAKTSKNMDRIDSHPLQIPEYKIGRELGRGGMGIVYEAMQTRLDRRVALKVLPGKCLASPVAVARFQNEIRAAAGLHHNNIVPIFEAGDAEGVIFYAMQLIDGWNLDRIRKEIHESRLGQQSIRGRKDFQLPAEIPSLVTTIIAQKTPIANSAGRTDFTGALPKFTRVNFEPESFIDRFNASQDDFATSHLESPRLDVARLSSDDSLDESSDLSNQIIIPSAGRAHWRFVAEIGVQIASALHHAHQRGVIHRDVKPANIILDRDGVAWLADFGLAQSSNSDLLGKMEAPGTLRYMAPERFQGDSSVASDTYALGITLFELLVLESPFLATEPLEVINQIRQGELVPLQQLDSTIPQDLVTIITKAIAYHPSDRYASTGEFSQDLRCFLDQRPISARPIGVVERTKYWCWRSPWMATLLGILIIGSFVSLAAIINLWRQADLHLIQANQNLQLAESKNDNLLELIGSLTMVVCDVETDPKTVGLQKDLLHMICQGYDQIHRSANGSMDSDTVHQAGVAWFKLGRVENHLGNTPNMLHAYQQAEMFFQELTERNPDELEYRFDLFHALISQDKQDEAIVLIESIATEDQCQNPFYLDAYSHSLRKMGERQLQFFLSESALKYLNQAKTISERLSQRQPQESLHLKKLGQINIDMARAKVRQREVENGYPFLLESIERLEQAFQLKPVDDGIHFDLIRSLMVAAGWNLIMNNLDLAGHYVLQADFATNSFMEKFPEHSVAWRMRQLWHQFVMIKAYYFSTPEDFGKARESYEGFLTRRLALKPDCWQVQSELAWLISDPSFTVQPDIEIAWNLIQKAIQNPSAGSMHGSVSLLAFRNGDFSRALLELDALENEIPFAGDSNPSLHAFHEFRRFCEFELELIDEPGSIQDRTLEDWQRIDLVMSLQFISAFHLDRSFEKECRFLIDNR